MINNKTAMATSQAEKAATITAIKAELVKIGISRSDAEIEAALAEAKKHLQANNLLPIKDRIAKLKADAVDTAVSILTA